MDATEFTCQTLPSRHPQLRIAMVTETYPPEVNGVAMTLGRMVDGLQVRNHQVQLIRPRQHADPQAQPTVTFSEHLQRGIALPHHDGLKMGLPAKAALTRLWTKQRPDVVQIATEGPLGWSALAAANKLRLPVASDFHTNFHTNFHSYSSHYGFGLLRRAIVAYLRKFHNKAAVTLVPTAGIRRELLGHGYENIEIIGRGVDTRQFHPARRDPALRARWGAGEGETVALYGTPSSTASSRCCCGSPGPSPSPANSWTGHPPPAPVDKEPTMHSRLSLAAHHGLNRLAAREHAFLARLNGGRLPGWEVGLLRLASRAGDGVFWYALMLALVAWQGQAALPAVLHMIVAGLAGTLIYKWLKGATERPRPYQACPTICCLTAPLDRFSFPSGHTLHAVVFSLVATAYYPALGWLVWPFTALVALSRLVLGLHYVSDVLVGALLGGAVAALMLAL